MKPVSDKAVRQLQAPAQQVIAKSVTSQVERMCDVVTMSRVV